MTETEVRARLYHVTGHLWETRRYGMQFRVALMRHDGVNCIAWALSWEDALARALKAWLTGGGLYLYEDTTS